MVFLYSSSKVSTNKQINPDKFKIAAEMNKIIPTLNCVEIEIIIIFIMNKHYDEEFSSQGGGDM